LRPSVDQTEAGNAERRIALDVSDWSRLREGPDQSGRQAEIDECRQRCLTKKGPGIQ
jgi:hypothetical protein